MDQRLVCLDSYSTISMNFVKTLITLPPKEREIWMNQSRLGATLTTTQINLDWPLLDTATSFWDPSSMVFYFGEQELTPTIEELESILDWEHCLDINVMIQTYKPSYFKYFHVLGISKASLPKKASGKYMHYPFDLLLERSWKKAGDFSDLIKFKAFTLVVLG